MKNLKIQDPELRMVLDAPCKFEDYDVVYNREEHVNTALRRAKRFNVTISTKNYKQMTKQLVTQPRMTETCTGTVENCIRFLRPMIEADYGFEVGLVFNITDKKLLNDPKFKAAFVKFIDWISASMRFDDFKAGCLEGTGNVKKLLRK